MRARQAVLGAHQEGNGGDAAKGATLIHDKERAHNVLVRELSLENEAYNANISNPVYLEQMALVNNLHSWIKRYLWRFTGMGPANLQSYPNLYVHPFRVRRDNEKLPKIARVVRHLIMTDARFRSST